MKINYLELQGYKNLNNIFINFEDNVPVHALIGNNGSGKSNILEALSIVFISVYLGKENEINFTFIIDYDIDGYKYTISNMDGFSFTQNGKNITAKDRISSLPSNLFLYYCGETTRMREIGARTDNDFESALKNRKREKIKFASFICLDDFEALLVALTISQTSYAYTMLQELLDLTGFGVPIKLHISRPEKWKNKDLDIKKGVFWKAHDVVADILHTFSDAGTVEVIDNLNFSITINELTKLHYVADTAYEMFVKLKLLMQVGMLKEIKISVVKDHNELLSSQLSEGEKQIALLLALLEVTSDYKALFLLDEFDSYLHPSWQRKFAEIIQDLKIRGQVIFTTHSPLTLGKMQKSSIRIIKDGDVFAPSSETFNRDISEVLDEIMGVGKRPRDVDAAIAAFKDAATDKNIEIAKINLETLKSLLTDEDPFWRTANHIMSRLEG